jgi:cytochrome c oxidase assembly protein subunit 11
MNRRKLTLFGLLCLLGGMATLTAYATGYGGTTQVVGETTGKTLDRMMTIRFNADSSSALPWKFAAKQASINIRVGEPALALYTVRSFADHPVVSTATFNVVPAKAGKYFNKIDCFCFTEQKLRPGETVESPMIAILTK